MKKKSIHINEARIILRSKQELDLKFWEKDGSIVNCNHVICISDNYKNNTFNIKFMVSGEIRRIRAVSIFEINGMEVYL